MANQGLMPRGPTFVKALSMGGGGAGRSRLLYDHIAIGAWLTAKGPPLSCARDRGVYFVPV